MLGVIDCDADVQMPRVTRHKNRIFLRTHIREIAWLLDLRTVVIARARTERRNVKLCEFLPVQTRLGEPRTAVRTRLVGMMSARQRMRSDVSAELGDLRKSRARVMPWKGEAIAKAMALLAPPRKGLGQTFTSSA